MNNFNSSPISTQRCKLRPVKSQDLQDFLLLQSNPYVRKYLGGTQSKEVITEKFKALRDNNFSVWVIHNEEGLFIGVIYLSQYKETIETEISYEFLPEFWGKGYAFEALCSIISIYSTGNNSTKLMAETQQNNTASCKLLEKLGFIKACELQRYGEIQSVYKIFFKK